jgi:asparagine synthase (glutamine-hydrolysing)
MYHFISLIWNRHDANTFARAAGLREQLLAACPTWQEIVRRDGCNVFAYPDAGRKIHPYVSPDGNAVVLGRLFPTEMSNWTPGWEPELTRSTASELYASRGKALARKFWGTYIAILSSELSDIAYVIRDCSGGIPCYFRRIDGVTIFFSDVSDLRKLSLPRCAIDWRYLAAFIYSTRTEVRRCGLTEISEMLSGEGAEVGSDSVTQYTAWDPASVAALPQLEDHDEASALLRDTTQLCCNAWASTFDRIMHRLSGGFDSSVVLGCLRRTPSLPAVTCYNEFGEGTAGDERRYARLVASKSSATLVEQSFPSSGSELFTPHIFGTQRDPKPSIGSIYSAATSKHTIAAARELGVDSIWTGQGGDHLFLALRNALGAADYYWHHGCSVGLSRAIADAARLSNIPYWLVFKRAVSLGRRNTTWSVDSVMKRQRYFVNAEALPKDIQGYVDHPWTANIGGLPKGKQLQIQLLSEVANRHRPEPQLEVVDQHHPLLSQPLMELSLRVPTYLLLTGGRTRGLARDAFKEYVPTEILQREDKGDTSAYVVGTIRRGEAFIQELLLDGVLVREKIICRDAVEAHFVHGQPLRMEQCWPLLACVAAEIWAAAQAA